jgi:tripartite-type tricarboxylate transporter receptor subunit TctC
VVQPQGFTPANNLYRTLKYDPQKDFTPISRVAEFPFFLMTRSDAGVKSLQEYIERARQEKGELKVGAAATVTTIAAEVLNRAAGIRTTAIQYKGTGDNTLALMRGDVDFIVDTDATAAQYVKAGRMRMLANSGARRVPNYPDVPTYQEVVPGKPEMMVWYGVVAPASLSSPLVSEIAADVAWAMQRPSMQALLRERSLDSAAAGPEEFKQRIAFDSKKYGELIRTMNITID